MVKDAKSKRLAAMYGNPNKITRGDVIAARIASSKKNGKKMKVKKMPKRRMGRWCVNTAVEIAAVVEDNGSS